MNVLDERGKVLFSDTIDAAKRYAKKHNLLLVNYEGDPNSHSKAIQMQVLSQKKVAEDAAAAGAESNQIKTKKKKADAKKFNLSESTSDHDLDVKLRKMAFFLNKNQRVRVVISGFKMDLKFGILDKIKKRFSPHLSFKQISSNTSSVKLYIVPESTFSDFYASVYLKGQEELQNVEDDGEEIDEDDLIGTNEDLEGMISEKMKPK